MLSVAEKLLRFLEAHLGQIRAHGCTVGSSEGIHECGFRASEMLANVAKGNLFLEILLDVAFGHKAEILVRRADGV